VTGIFPLLTLFLFCLLVEVFAQCRKALFSVAYTVVSKVKILFESVRKLVLAEVELIFYRVAGTGLCFGFVRETALITPGCFSYCRAAFTQSQGLFCFSPHPTSKQAVGAQKCGLDTAGTADPS